MRENNAITKSRSCVSLCGSAGIVKQLALALLGREESAR